MSEHPRVALDPAVLAGKPVVRGTRLSVAFLLGLLADGWSEARILASYPALTHDDIMACLAYARDVLNSQDAGSNPPATEPDSQCDSVGSGGESRRFESGRAGARLEEASAPSARVSFSDLEAAFEYVSFDGGGQNHVYLCRETGHLYLHSDFGDNFEELPDDLEDDDGAKYIELPGPRDLDLG